jgi:lipid A disaccharide synthetase
LAAIGGLRFDGILERWEDDGSPNRKSIAALREDLGLRPDCPVVLLCTGLDRSAARWVESTIDAIRLARVDTQIAVKLHQYHGGHSVVFDVARRKDFCSLVAFEDSLPALIRLADVVIAGPSTVVLESRLAGTPCIVFEAIEGYPVYPFGAHELADPVGNTRDLATVLSAVLERERFPGDVLENPRPERLQAHLNNLDRGACHRLASLLRNLDRE